MKPILSILAFWGFTFCAHSQKAYDFNTTCIQAFQEIDKLKIKQGKLLAEKAKQLNQDNLIPLLLESYADFYLLFYNENAEDYNRLYPKFQERLNSLEEGPKNSPFYLFSLAIVRLQRSIVSIKFGNNWDAAWDYRKWHQECTFCGRKPQAKKNRLATVF